VGGTWACICSFFACGLAEGMDLKGVCVGVVELWRARVGVSVVSESRSSSCQGPWT